MASRERPPYVYVRAVLRNGEGEVLLEGERLTQQLWRFGDETPRVVDGKIIL